MCLRSFFIGCVLLTASLAACTSQETPNDLRGTAPPTPSVGILRVNGTAANGPRLRVTLPSIKLLHDDAPSNVQLLLALADRDGTYSYVLYPANRAGDAGGQFDLSQTPLEISLTRDSSVVKLWVLALNNRRYEAAEMIGIEALASRLGLGFRGWVENGDAADDPLAAVVSASDGALFEWFAGVDVAGQDVVTLRAADGWSIGLASQHSEDGAMSVVYTVQHLPQTDTSRAPSPTPTSPTPTSTTQPAPRGVLIDENFAGGTSPFQWYEGAQSTYVNRIVDGAYEIRLTDISQRDFALSWGSLDDAEFENYRVEAEVSLLDGDAAQARYGIWFNFQDDYNFLYFGISGDGEYRAAVILRNADRVELQDWIVHSAIRRASSNTLTVDAYSSGDVVLSINGTQVLSFNDQTFTKGSVAFFCYAKSVPTTCRLEHLRVTSLEN